MTTVEFWDESVPIAELESIPGGGWVWGWVSPRANVTMNATFGSIDEAANELENTHG